MHDILSRKFIVCFLDWYHFGKKFAIFMPNNIGGKWLFLVIF